MKCHARAFDLWLLGVSALFCLGFWYWAKHVYIPANAAEVRARKIPVGNNSDLYPRWLGARELLLRHRDPYSAEITREIQTGFYGRPLDPQNKSDPRDKESFVYPLWVVFLLAPSVAIPFTVVIQIFRWLMLCSVALSVIFWAYAFALHLRPLIVVSGILLALGTLPSLVEYYQQNLTALLLLFAAMATTAVVRNRLALGGFLLAITTMKPDTCCLLIMWFLVWAFSRLKERQRILWTFAATTVVFLVTSEVISPHSTAHFIAAVREYSTYATTPNILQLLFPSFLGTLFSFLLLFLLFGLWFKWRTAAAGTLEFRWALAWTCVVILALIPKIAGYNQLLLIPPLFMLLGQFRNVQKSGIIPRALASAPFACFLLQWLAAAILSLWSLLNRATLSQELAFLPDHIGRAIVPLTLLAMATTTFLASRDRFTHAPVTAKLAPFSAH